MDGELALEREKCRRSAHYFVFESGLVTKDEHDVLNPTKPFPDTLYLRSLLDCCLVSGGFLPPESAKYALEAGHSVPWLRNLADSAILCVEKSRQMIVSWLVSAYCLWRAKYHAHQLIMVQSKKEEDAAVLVYSGKEPYFARISFMESHLPKHLRTLQFPKHATFGHLFIPNGSEIVAIPEGGAQIRSRTPSLIFSDECGFQDEFDKAYTASLPAVKGGGQAIFVSSAEPGAYQQLIEGPL